MPRAVRITLVATTMLAAAASPLLPPPTATAQANAEGVWELTGSLSVARFDHTMTLLGNGRVLAAGGRNTQSSPVNFRSAELYDPLSEVWTLTGSLIEYRWRHTATLLPNGKVLVAGGFGGSETGLTTNAQPVLGTAELYDPATGVWTPTGSLHTRRALHSAALLPDGRVLVAGGRTCGQPPPATCNFQFVTNTAEVYDPATGLWTPTASLSAPRHTTAAVRLSDGRVLVPAGFVGAGSPTNTADLYDPAGNTWTQTGNLSMGRARQGAMLLNDGRVLVALGFPANQTTEVYDPGSDSWFSADNLEGFNSRFNFSYAVLPNGKALVAGGQTFPPSALTRDTDIYDPATNQWSAGGVMNDTHGSGSSLANSDPAIVLSAGTSSYVPDPAVCGRNCGKALVAGNNATGTTELYTAADTCYGLTPGIVATPGNDTIAGTPGNDVILLLGGDDRVSAGDGNDVICGGDGGDLIVAGAGNDVVLGGGGVDRVSGGDGADAVFSEVGDDQLDGGPGVDTADGGPGTDRCAAETTRHCP